MTQQLTMEDVQKMQHQGSEAVSHSHGKGEWENPNQGWDRNDLIVYSSFALYLIAWFVLRVANGLS